MSSRPSRCLVRGAISECAPQQNIHSMTSVFLPNRYRRALSRYSFASSSLHYTQLRGCMNHIVSDAVRPGETIFSTELERRVGGKGASQAVAVARAGGNVALVGAVGEDGGWVIDQLRAYGVDVSAVHKAEVRQDDEYRLHPSVKAQLQGPTGRSTILLSPNGQKSISQTECPLVIPNGSLTISSVCILSPSQRRQSHPEPPFVPFLIQIL